MIELTDGTKMEAAEPSSGYQLKVTGEAGTVLYLNIFDMGHWLNVDVFRPEGFERARALHFSGSKGHVWDVPEDAKLVAVEFKKSRKENDGKTDVQDG